MHLKPIPGFPSYFASAGGTVYSTKQGPLRALKGYQDVNTGYLYVCLRKNLKNYPTLVHVAVLLAFIGPRPKGAVSRHLNGKQRDNRAANLCWGSQKQNMADRERHGNTARGEKHCRATITMRQATKVKKMLAEGHRVADIARAVKAEYYVVSTIKQGRTWRHLEAN